MTHEEKQLLLKDLCARLPYGVKVVDVMGRVCELKIGTAELIDLYYSVGDDWSTPIKPYLRPLLSMTEEEEFYIEQKWNADKWGDMTGYASGESSEAEIESSDIVGFQDWLNEHHFDYHKLIDKGLALEAPAGMYND